MENNIGKPINLYKRKIAIIDPVGVKAGMDYYDLSLLKALSKLSVKTYLFSNLDRKDSNIYIKRVFDANIKSKFKKAINFFLGYWGSYRECKAKKIDFIVLHIFSASYLNLVWTLLAKLFRLRMIVIAHDISSFSNDDKMFVKKIVYNKLADSIIVHNKFSYKELIKIIGRKSLEKIFIIKQGNYMDLIKKYPKKEAKKLLKFNDNYKYILFFGQIKKTKGLNVLLKAIPFVDKSIKLIIAGRPWKDDFSNYQQIINNLKIQDRIIKHIKYITDDERDLLFSASDAFVMPYKRIYQSAVLLMGFSYGIPVIASDLEPHSEVIEHKINGILFKSEDHLSLAKAINDLLSDQNLLLKIKEETIKTAKNEFSWDKIAEEYIKVLWK